MSPQTAPIQQIKLAAIRIDGDTQSRADINQDVVSDYAEALTAGAKFPPVVLFHDGMSYWLADGFHRHDAHRKIGALDIDAEVRAGGQIDAKLCAYGANQSHGLRRTSEDKRKAIAGMLAHFADWSDNRIAKHVGVSDKTVTARREAIFGNSEDETTRLVERNGKSYAQKTANIGKGKVSLPQAVKQLATVASKVESDSTTAASTAPAKPSVTDQRPIEDAFVDTGPSDSEIAFFEEMEKARQNAFDSVVLLADEDDKLAGALRRISELEEDNARLRAEVRVVTESRNGLMNANNELIRINKSQQRKLAQLEKAAA